MKVLLPLAFLLTTAPALASDIPAPKQLVIGGKTQFQLQGWTRLNGTTPFQVTKSKEIKAEAAPTQDRAARRARALQAEAEFQKKKKQKLREKGKYAYEY